MPCMSLLFLFYYFYLQINLSNGWSSIISHHRSLLHTTRQPSLNILYARHPHSHEDLPPSSNPLPSMTSTEKEDFNPADFDFELPEIPPLPDPDYQVKDFFSSFFSSEKEKRLPPGLQAFKHHSVAGMRDFQKGDLASALNHFDLAVAGNSSQALPQRGIALYIANRFEEAALQLTRDVNILEAPRMCKASELRTWLSAVYYKLNKTEEAIHALDLNNSLGFSLIYNGELMNKTHAFFAGEMPLEDILERIGTSNERDISGWAFYGNFYLGLYFDAVYQSEMARVFLSFPRASTRYRPSDMWYHVPRALYKSRFGEDDDPPQGQAVNSLGLIL